MPHITFSLLFVDGAGLSGSWISYFGLWSVFTGRVRCGWKAPSRSQRTVGWMSGDHDRCFLTLVLEAFRQVFFNTNVLPCITIGADVWGDSDIMTGVY